MTHRFFHSRMPYEGHWERFAPARGLERALREEVHRRYHVYDADVCGAIVIEWVVDGPEGRTFWRTTHDWWIQETPEWECVNEVEAERIDGVGFRFPTIDRDWMKIRPKIG